jgi:hypothetical protein
MLVLFNRKSRISCRFLHGGQLIRAWGDVAHFEGSVPHRKSLKNHPFALT